jgi:hypothetical protein
MKDTNLQKLDWNVTFLSYRYMIEKVGKYGCREGHIKRGRTRRGREKKKENCDLNL